MKTRVDGVRFSNLFVHKPGRKYDDAGKEKYAAHGIVDRDAPAVTIVKDAVIAAAKNTWPNNWEAKLKAISAAGRVWCLRDGDGKVDKAGNPKPAYVGKMYVSAKSEAKVGVFGTELDPVTKGAKVLDPSSGKPYSGSYGAMLIEIRASDVPQPQVYAVLLGVQFAEDGEPLGNETASATDFEAFKQEPAQMPAERAASGGGAASLF